MISEKQYTELASSLRELIHAGVKPFSGSRDDQANRIRQASTDMEFFAKTYSPHYLTRPNSLLHTYLYSRLTTMIQNTVKTGEGDREVNAAPRGNAKSTITTLLLPLWCIAFQYRRFILIVSDTASQSEEFVQFIKAELETNERLRQDYSDMCGVGPVWRASSIITRNGVRVRGLGTGQKLRGMRHGAFRPDLVICDDLENDEHVASAEQREKLEKWFFRALMKTGKRYTVYLVIGTILHYDSLMSRLLKKPGWKGKTFRSVIRWSQNRLWEKWEAIITDNRLDRETAEIQADRFFHENKDAMLAGTEVLWPEEEDYYYLMKRRISEGPAHFDSEKQNEPINPEDCLFREEWFRYFDDDAIDLKDTPLFVAVDPSLGKSSRRSDPSAILGGRIKEGIIYLEIADIQRRHPDQIIADILLYHEKMNIYEIGVEVVQFQQFFKDMLEKTAHEKGHTLLVKEIRQNRDKILRIQTLQPWIKNGWIRFKPNMGVLIDQLKKFPLADHDDGPDALEMLKTLMETGPIAYGGFDPDSGSGRGDLLITTKTSTRKHTLFLNRYTKEAR